MMPDLRGRASEDVVQRHVSCSLLLLMDPLTFTLAPWLPQVVLSTSCQMNIFYARHGMAIQLYEH